MTDKRFTIKEIDNFSYGMKVTEVILDNDGIELPQSTVCDLLNKLHKENQLLHKTIEELDNCQKGQSHRINDLYLENKQLKDLIIHLGYTIKYDGYRHISLELKR